MILQKERELIVEYGKKLITHGLTKGTGGNISIYNKDNNKYYHKEIKVDKITREENKSIIIEEIITMLINIIN